MKAYLKSNPGQLDWQKLNISDFGYRLVQQNQKQYVGERVAQWDLDLKPRPDHFDQRITVTTPLQKAGAYLLTAKMADGNTSQIIIWVEDTAIVKKPLAGAIYYYVGDAQAGRRSPKRMSNSLAIGSGRSTRIDSPSTYAILPKRPMPMGKLSTKTKDRTNSINGSLSPRPPVDGWPIWASPVSGAATTRIAVQPNQGLHDHRSAGLSARQKVHFKFWVRHAQYDQDDKSEFANQTFNVEIQNPKGKKF